MIYHFGIFVIYNRSIFIDKKRLYPNSLIFVKLKLLLELNYRFNLFASSLNETEPTAQAIKPIIIINNAPS